MLAPVRRRETRKIHELTRTVRIMDCPCTVAQPGAFELWHRGRTAGRNYRPLAPKALVRLQVH